MPGCRNFCLRFPLTARVIAVITASLKGLFHVRWGCSVDGVIGGNCCLFVAYVGYVLCLGWIFQIEFRCRWCFNRMEFFFFYKGAEYWIFPSDYSCGCSGWRDDSTKWERMLYQFFLLDAHSMLILILRIIYLIKVRKFISIFCVHRIVHCINYNTSSYISSVYKKVYRMSQRTKRQKLTCSKKMIFQATFFSFHHVQTRDCIVKE